MTEVNQSDVPPDQQERQEHSKGAPDSAILEPFVQQLREWGEYAAYFLTAKADRLKVSARSAFIYGLFIGLIILVTAGLMIVGGWFMVLGLAGGLGEWFGSAWLGNLVAGLVVLLGSAGAMVLGTRKFNQRMKQRTIERYEQRQRNQESAFGHSVDSRADDVERSAD